jgi:predicted transcriptional regulator
MPYPTLKDVLETVKSNRNLVLATPNQSLTNALRNMQSHSYSQLPVVDSEDQLKPIGLVTADSILNAMTSLGSREATINDLRVQHAMTLDQKNIREIMFKMDDVLDLAQKRLQNAPAVLVVGDNDRLNDIITPFDTSEYYRRRARNMMLVEQIETDIREHIRAAYEFNEDKLSSAARSAKFRPVTKEKFSAALNRYLTSKSFDKAQLPLVSDAEVIDAFKILRVDDETPVSFSDLTLSEFITMLFDSKLWDRYKVNFGDLNQKLFRSVLENVRKIRNDIFHFKATLTLEQEKELDWCANFLARHEYKPKGLTKNNLSVW